MMYNFLLHTLNELPVQSTRGYWDWFHSERPCVVSFISSAWHGYEFDTGDPDCWHCGASSWHKGIIDAKKFSSLTWHLFHGLVKVSIITEWWGIVIANFVDLNIQGFDLCDRSPTVTLSSSMGLSYLPDSVVQCSAYLFREGLTFYTVLKCWVMTYLALRCTKAYIIDFSVSCMDLKQNRL